MSKPIVVFPKRASLGEQRNDHQLAVVRHFQRSKSIVFAETEAELSRVLDRVFNPDRNENFAVNDVASWPVDESLIQFVEGFVS
jgi:UDP-N-acetylglucosamine transferase subunit ALG13